MNQVIDDFRSRDYWLVENAQYEIPSFRLQKCAAILNKMAGKRNCTLLDVGCGPAALQPLLSPNISYFGIDIAIQRPAPYLSEIDVSREEIGFDQQHFDFIVALGFFEYAGTRQRKNLEEIRAILKLHGKFLMSYINFGHFRKAVWPNYNNVRSIADMKQSLSEVFTVERCFPASHHWRHKQPGKNALPRFQMLVNRNVPIVSPLFAVEYFFICSHKS